MKQVVLLFSALILISCNKFKVEGTAKGIKDGTKVFLEGFGEMGPIAMDTVEINEGKFEFEGKSELPEIGFVSIDGVIDPQYQTRKSLPFIIESGTIEIDFDSKDILKSKISGTTENELFQKYTDESIILNKPRVDFEKKNNVAMKQAMETNNVAVQKQLNEEYGQIMQSISAKMDAKTKGYIKNNTSSILSMLFLENYVSRGMMQGKEAKDAFDKLDKKLYETKSGKNVKKALDAQLKAAAPEKKK
ncbi:MAG: hypothetical protein RI980_2187 [Bacteroidota bacterium]|jgi:hypothetical protein|nr:MAG: DUF4369 domain-containing protein [Flavobacteriia bacterium]